MNVANTQVEPIAGQKKHQAPSEMHPLVSCIMPTHNRRHFVSQAIKYFLRQDYPNRELIIIDDGNDPIEDLVPQDPRIRYLRQEHKSNVGAKRNLACQEAKGEIVVHWDDDDWMADWRLSYQVQSLLSAQADICGLSTLLFYDLSLDQAWQYRYPRAGPAWLAGGTFCYTKAFWRAHPFPEVNAGEDTRFILSIPSKKMLVLEDSSFYAILIHPGNTNSRVIPGKQWRSYPVAEIRTLLGTDVEFYRHFSLAERNNNSNRQGQSQQTLSIGDMRASREMPLVSCIMPTYNRRHFVRLALNYFLQQDYPNKELVVVDDGTDPIGDLLEGIAEVRYIHLPSHRSIGTKRNLACAHACGEIIAHWDDDDWYAPERLSYQVEPIIAGQADMTGLENLYLLTIPDNEFWKSSTQLQNRMFVGNVHGGTLMYRKTLWEQGLRYPKTNLAEDAALVRQVMHRGKRLVRLANDGVFVYVRHSHAAWQFEPGRFLDPSGWERIPPPSFFSPATLSFYQIAALGVSPVGTKLN